MNKWMRNYALFYFINLKEYFHLISKFTDILLSISMVAPASPPLKQHNSLSSKLKAIPTLKVGDYCPIIVSSIFGLNNYFFFFFCIKHFNCVIYDHKHTNSKCTARAFFTRTHPWKQLFLYVLSKFVWKWSVGNQCGNIIGTDSAPVKWRWERKWLFFKLFL